MKCTDKKYEKYLKNKYSFICNYQECEECEDYKYCKFTKQNNPNHSDYLSLKELENQIIDAHKQKEELEKQLSIGVAIIKEYEEKNKGIIVEKEYLDELIKQFNQELVQKRRSLGLL